MEQMPGQKPVVGEPEAVAVEDKKEAQKRNFRENIFREFNDREQLSVHIMQSLGYIRDEMKKPKPDKDQVLGDIEVIVTYLDELTNNPNGQSEKFRTALGKGGNIESMGRLLDHEDEERRNNFRENIFGEFNDREQLSVHIMQSLGYIRDEMKKPKPDKDQVLGDIEVIVTYLDDLTRNAEGESEAFKAAIGKGGNIESMGRLL